MAASDLALLRHLLSLRGTKESALFDVLTGDLTTTLVIDAGELVGATASKPGEPIGRILRRKGMISPEHYVEVLERLSDVLSIGEQVRFGEVAVGLAYARPEDVAVCLTEQRRGVVLRVFQSTSATWTIRPLRDDRERSNDVPMNVEAIFLDAVRWVDDARKGELGLDEARLRALAPAWDLAEIDRRFELTQDEADFVRVAVAGDKTTSELFALKVPDAVDVHALLTALIAAQAVALRDPGSPQVHQTIPVPAAAAHDVPVWARVDADSARGAVVKITKARATAPAMKAVRGPVEQSLEAERAFQRGRDLFRSNDVAGALPFFEEASTADPTSIEYALFAEWCREAVTNPELTEAARAKLAERARAGLQQNPKCAFGYFVHAEILRSEGKSNEARVQLARALRLDADLFEGIRAKRAARLRSSRHSWTDEAPPPASEALPSPAPSPSEPAPAPPPQFVPLDMDSEAPPPRKGPPLRALLALFVLLGVIGIAALTATAIRRHGALPTTIVSTAVSDLPVVSASIAPAASASTAPSSASVDAGQALPGASAPAPAASTGTLVFSKGARGHRRFIDGHVNESHNPKIELPCGRHEVRIGSHGKARAVQVPCGGEIAVE